LINQLAPFNSLPGARKPLRRIFFSCCRFGAPQEPCPALQSVC
jgi:hypothetical protein